MASRPPRRRRAKIGALVTATAIVIWGSPRSSHATMPMASRMPGMASRTSTTRIRTLSARPPAGRAGEGAHEAADDHAEDDRTEPDEEADPRAVHDPGELVAALQVLAHEVLRTGRIRPRRARARIGRRRGQGARGGRREEGGEGRGADEDTDEDEN